MRRFFRALAAAAAVVALSTTAACGRDADPADAARTLTVAAVDNGDLDRLRDLTQTFTDAHPGTQIEWVRQGENEIREMISTDVGTEGGRFDVVTIGPFEARIWGERQLLTPLTDMPAGFDPNQFVPAVRDSVSHGGQLQAAPFYGESAFTMYRRDLFAQAGVTMPDQPTWQFVIDAAQRVAQTTGVPGICLRGQAGWGENMAFVTAMAHSYGALWFDDQWRAQLNTPQWQRTVQDYLTLARSAPPSVADNGFAENLALFQQGQCAMWIDATSAASFVVDPTHSSVADQVGFAMAPASSQAGEPMSWLWTWALAVPTNSDNPQLAKEFVAWATSAEYQRLAASHYGPVGVPPGARSDLYADPAYTQAAPYAPLVLASIERADVAQSAPGAPYEGAQYVAVAPFTSIGNAVGQQLNQAIRGEISEAEALENSQWVADRVIEQTRLMADQANGN